MLLRTPLLVLNGWWLQSVPIELEDVGKGLVLLLVRGPWLSMGPALK
jgi:hypothetical protein